MCRKLEIFRRWGLHIERTLFFKKSSRIFKSIECSHCASTYIQANLANDTQQNNKIIATETNLLCPKRLIPENCERTCRTWTGLLTLYITISRPYNTMHITCINAACLPPCERETSLSGTQWSHIALESHFSHHPTCTNAQSTFLSVSDDAGAAHHHRFLSSALAAALLPVYMPHHPFPRGPLLPQMVQASTSSRETPPPEEELDRRSSSIAALRLKAREHELKLRDLDLSS